VATAAVRVSAFSSAHLRLTLMLPQTAPNALQGQRSGLTYTFTGAQAPKKR
jgi:hypothetical protein